MSLFLPHNICVCLCMSYFHNHAAVRQKHMRVKSYLDSSYKEIFCLSTITKVILLCFCIYNWIKCPVDMTLQYIHFVFYFKCSKLHIMFYHIAFNFSLYSVETYMCMCIYIHALSKELYERKMWLESWIFCLKTSGTKH